MEKFRLKYCPKCDNYLYPQSDGGMRFLVCKKCGYKEYFFEQSSKSRFSLEVGELRKILEDEKRYAERRLNRSFVRGKILHIHNRVLTIDIGMRAQFQGGDYLRLRVKGYGWFEGKVLSCIGGVIIVMLNGAYKISPYHREIYVAVAEPLIGLELQLDLLNYFNRRPLDIKVFNKRAFDVFFSDISTGKLKFREPSDINDLKGRFSLDSSQVKAVKAALGLEDNELLLIVGPPGTGKTRVVAKIAYELMLRGEKVLISSHTNRAVDNAIELLPLGKTLRVGHHSAVHRNVHEYLIGYKARSQYSYIKKLLKRRNEILEEMERIQENMKIGLSDFTKVMRKLSAHKSELVYLEQELERKLEDVQRREVEAASIIGSTLIKSQLQPLRDVSFDAIIIDEASQALITLALLGMVKAKKWILVGDHCQLQPILRSAGKDKLRREVKYSSFTFLKHAYEARVLWLKIHYRSNKDIIAFSAKTIYNGNITPSPSCDKKFLKLKCKTPREDLSPNKPVVFIHVDGECLCEQHKASRSCYNELESKASCRLALELLKCGVNPEEIGIIAPYRAQRALIVNELQKAIKNYGSSARENVEMRRKIYRIEVSTVDSFQGREKEVILFSVTATKPSQIKFVSNVYRLNVALTRARHKLIVIGNLSPIEKSKTTLLYDFVNYCREKDSIYYWSK